MSVDLRAVGLGGGWLRFVVAYKAFALAMTQMPLIAALNQQPVGAVGTQANAGARPGPAAPQLQPDDLRDILPPVEVSFWTTGMLVSAVIAGLLVLGLLIWGVVALARRQKPSLPPATAREVALAALSRLRSGEGMALLSRDFAAEVGVVLRRYLEAIYGIQVTRQTTEEFLVALEGDVQFEPEERDQLRRFLSRCDRFKFAGETVEVGAREDLIEVVTERVNRGAQS